MIHLKLILLNYLLNSLWQVSVIFLVATLAARIARPTGPHTQHRIWVIALFLEVALPACAFAPTLRGLFTSLLHSGSAHVTIQTTVLGVTQAHNPSRLAAVFASTALIACIALSIFFSVRLLYRLHRTRALRRTAHLITLTGDPLSTWQRFTRIFGIHNAQLAASAAIVGPSTIGIRRRIVLLPPALLTNLLQEDLAAALAHEFAHMRRRDFAKNLLYELIALPIAWHPFLWLTRLRIAESREMVCDELAADATHGVTGYAHSLLRLAASFSRRSPAVTAHAIGILDANILEKRVMTLNRKRTLTAASRRISIAAAVLLGAAACASAMSLRIEVPPQTIASSAAMQDSVDASISSAESRALWARTAAHAQVSVAAGVEAGQIVSKVNPIYPPIARASHVTGAVVLHAIIGKDGTIQQLAVLSGPPMLVASAMEAVKQWVYKPYLLNGEPVAVDTTITVNYALDTQQPPSPPPPPDSTHQDAYKVSGPDGEIYNVGGSVLPPVATYTPDPQYSQQARDAGFSGKVILGLIVDADGNVRNVHVVRGVGMGLDEKAVEAVQQYRFKPATQNGNPVAVKLNIEVNFQFFGKKPKL